jgi:hypothetical protein
MYKICNGMATFMPLNKVQILNGMQCFLTINEQFVLSIML